MLSYHAHEVPEHDTDQWPAGLSIVDFTIPHARAWYAGKLQALRDMGVDSFKTDFGERIPTDVAYYDHSDLYKMHNFYSYLYNKVVFDVLRETQGEGEAAQTGSFCSSESQAWQMSQAARPRAARAAY